MIRATLLLLLCLCSISALALEPTTPEQQKKFVFIVQRLEQEPFGEVPDAARSWAMELVQNSSTINLKVNVALLSELMAAKTPDRLAIFGQFVLSQAVFVIDHPDAMEDAAANAVAGYTGAIHVYQKALKRDPKNRIDVWDELSKQEQAGTLKQHVEKLLKELKAKPKGEEA